jgi:hypothetical protein
MLFIHIMQYKMYVKYIISLFDMCMEIVRYMYSICNYDQSTPTNQ